MREKKNIREQFEIPAKSVGTVLLFFGAFLVVLWTAIALMRLALG